MENGYLSRFTRSAWVLLLATLFVPGALAASELDQAKEERVSGNAMAAIVQLKTHLQREPDDAPARLLLGEIYFDLGDAGAAETELERARRAGSSDSEVLPALVDALLAQRKLDQALALIAAADDDAAPALQATLTSQRGEALLGKGEVDAAAEAFRQAAAADPQAARPLIGLASIAGRAGDGDEVRKLLEQATSAEPTSALAWESKAGLEYDRGRLDAAIDAYSKALAHGPGRLHLRYKRAQAYVDAGDQGGATEDIAMVRRLAPQSPGINYIDGRLALMADQPALAAEKLEAYLGASPRDERAAYYSALALARSGRPEQARQRLESFVAENPAEPSTAILLAMTQLETGDPTGAERSIARFASGDQARPEAVELLRRSLVMQERYAEAAKLVEQAARQFPQLVSAQIALAAQLLQQQKADASAEILKEVLGREPSDQRAWELLVRAEIAAGHMDAARAAADNFVKQLPESPLAHTVRGGLLAEKGDVAAAQAAFAHALELDPAFSRAALALAAIQLKTGSREAATKTLESFLETDPTSVDALLALAGVEGHKPGDEVLTERLDAALVRDPNNLALRRLLAQRYLAQDKNDRALELVQRAPGEQGNNPELLMLRATAEWRAGRRAEATATLTDVANAQPTIPRYRYLLASLYASAGDFAETESNLSQGLKLDQERSLQPRQLQETLSLVPEPQRQALLDHLLAVAPEHPAVVLTAVRASYGQEPSDAAGTAGSEKAVRMLDRLRTRYPDNQLVALEYARALAAAGRRDDAAKTLSDWLGLHSDDFVVRMLLAMQYLKLGKHDLAAEQYRAVVAQDPDNAAALNNLAWLHMERAPAEALSYAERALKVRPDDPAILDTLGAILLAQGKPQEALAPLEKAHSAAAQPVFALHYAEALARSGDQTKARKVLGATSNWPAVAREKAMALLRAMPDE